MRTRTEAAARARSDADYAFFSTAPGRRREVVRTRTEAAARARSDADYALLTLEYLLDTGSRVHIRRKLLLALDRTRTTPSQS